MVAVTGEDAVYAGWLNLLGSDEIEDHDPDIAVDLHLMHDTAEASHTIDGIRPHLPMTPEQAALQERVYREIEISPEVIEELRRYGS